MMTHTQEYVINNYHYPFDMSSFSFSVLTKKLNVGVGLISLN